MADEPEFDEARLQLLIRASEKLYPWITDRLEDSRLFRAPLTFRGRVKGDESIREKVRKKRLTTPDYTIDDITDLVGFRFVTMMRMGIADVTDALLSLLVAPPHEAPGDFGGATLKQFTQHISPPPQDINPETGEWIDPLSDKLEAQFAARYNGAPPFKFKPEIRAQYSGVHLIVEFPVPIAPELTISAEFQVRSVFEEAWAELDHKLFYKADNAGLLIGERRRLALSGHLGILKSLLDTAANYAELISQTDPTGPDGPKLDIRPDIDGDHYAEEVAGPIKHRRDVIEDFLALMREKRLVDSKRMSGDESLEGVYVGLANKFKDLFDKRFSQIEPTDFPKDQRDRVRSLAFLILMEQAISWFLGEKDTPVRNAIALYETITTKRVYGSLEGKNFPTAWFRLGEAKVWLLENAKDADERERLAREAADAFARARKTLSAVPKENRLIIAPEQRAYLNWNIERLQGFALWRLSDLRREAVGASPGLLDLENVREAWKAVKKHALALTIPFTDDQLNLFNTATYFATDGLQLCARLDKPTMEFPSLKVLKQMLDTLEKQMRVLDTRGERFAHTLMFGFIHLGDEERAVRYAEAVMDAAHEKIRSGRLSPYQKDMHDRVAREAWAYLKKLGRGPLETPP